MAASVLGGLSCSPCGSLENTHGWTTSQVVILGTAYASVNVFGVDELMCQFWVWRPKSNTDPSFALGRAVQRCPTCPTRSGFTVGLPLSLFHQKRELGLQKESTWCCCFPCRPRLSLRHPSWLLRSKEGTSQQIGAHWAKQPLSARMTKSLPAGQQQLF